MEELVQFHESAVERIGPTAWKCKGTYKYSIGAGHLFIH
jgi:hypothetical protein